MQVRIRPRSQTKNIMKATIRNTPPKQFDPITLELTFETEREYRIFKELIDNLSPYDATRNVNRSQRIIAEEPELEALTDTIYSAL